MCLFTFGCFEINFVCRSVSKLNERMNEMDLNGLQWFLNFFFIVELFLLKRKRQKQKEKRKKKEKRFSFGSCFNDNKVPVSLSMEATSFFPKNQLQKEKIQK